MAILKKWPDGPWNYKLKDVGYVLAVTDIKNDENVIRPWDNKKDGKHTEAGNKAVVGVAKGTIEYKVPSGTKFATVSLDEINIYKLPDSAKNAEVNKYKPFPIGSSMVQIKVPPQDFDSNKMDFYINVGLWDEDPDSPSSKWAGSFVLTLLFYG